MSNKKTGIQIHIKTKTNKQNPKTTKKPTPNKQTVKLDHEELYAWSLCFSVQANPLLTQHV